MTASVDLDAVADLLRNVATEHILPRFRRLGRDDISEKAPGNLVTVADVEAEHALTAALASLLPGSAVVGEEAVAADATVLQRLAAGAPTWIIDPIDGTMNFTKSIERFAVMVALVERGALRAGWIHDPVRNETGLAGAGSGAWLRAGDGTRQRLRRPDPGPLEGLRGAVSGRIGERGRARDILERSGRLPPVTRVNSAAHEYLDLARGRLDYVMFARTWPWDHAAGVLLYHEAGGTVAYLDGTQPTETPYSLLRHTGPLLAAPTPATWAVLREILMTA
jgi:fructose-1,6-bisphosphatase/inositol monophosphatase family enzyme